MSYEKIGNIIDNTKAETKKKWQESSILEPKLNIKNRILTSNKTLANDIYNKKSESSNSTGGAGYTSPLIEDTGNPRTYHDELLQVSSDGLFVFIIKPLNTINFKDSSTNQTPLQFTLSNVI